MAPITIIPYNQPAETHPLREDYLNSLGEAQELFLEILIRKADLYEIKVSETLAGYAIVSSDKRLLEFYLSPAAVNAADMLYGILIKKLSLKNTYVKSFDALSVSCAANHQSKLSVEGYLYRDRFLEKNISLPGDIISRWPIADDKQTILAINENVFESEEEIDEYIDNKMMHIFRRDNALLGLAIHTRVIKNHPEYDVGMLVAPQYRKQGLGAAFLSFAINHAMEKGGRPIMGCAADNIASQRTIESLGFISKHRMLEFTF